MDYETYLKQLDSCATVEEAEEVKKEFNFYYAEIIEAAKEKTIKYDRRLEEAKIRIEKKLEEVDDDPDIRDLIQANLDNRDIVTKDSLKKQLDNQSIMLQNYREAYAKMQNLFANLINSTKELVEKIDIVKPQMGKFIEDAEKENILYYGDSFAVELEAVRTALEPISKGEIELEQATSKGGGAKRKV